MLSKNVPKVPKSQSPKVPKPKKLNHGVLELIRDEIKNHFASFNNESAAYKSFEDHTTLEYRTLKRFINHETKAYPATILKFYQWIYKTNDHLAIVSNVRPEVIIYLAENGLDIRIERQEITSVITKSDIHFKIYLLTEDYQKVDKRELEMTYGKKGVEALNDLLMKEVLSAVDENIFTTGKIRSNYSIEYLKSAIKLINDMAPWEKLEKDSLEKGVNISLGSIVVSRELAKKINKICNDFVSELTLVHKESLKVKDSDKQTFSYSVMTLELAKTNGGVL